MYSDAGRTSVPEGMGCCGGELWVQGGMEGVLAGIQGGAENQPLFLAPPPAGAQFLADSLLPRGPSAADVCWTEHTVPTQPRLDHQVTGLVWGGFPLPCFHALPWPCCQHAWLGMLLPGAAAAELAPGEKKKAALAIEGNITIKWWRESTSACGDTVHSVPRAPAGVLAAPPGNTFVHQVTDASPLPLPWVPSLLLCSRGVHGSVKRAAGQTRCENERATCGKRWGAAP